MACGEPDYYKYYQVSHTDAEGNEYYIGDFPIDDDDVITRWSNGTFQDSDMYTYDPQKEELKKLLEELANTPILKIPFWIESHKEELERLGLNIKEMKKND